MESPKVAGEFDERVGSWSFGMSVSEILDLPLMEPARVLGGAAGLDGVVERLNMMEVPDVLPWVRSGEMLVTSGSSGPA